MFGIQSWLMNIESHYESDFVSFPYLLIDGSQFTKLAQMFKNISDDDNYLQKLYLSAWSGWTTLLFICSLMI